MTSSFASTILKGKHLDKIIMTSQTSVKKTINETTNHLKQIAQRNGLVSLSANQLGSERAIFVMLEKHLLKQNKFSGYKHKAFAYGSFINPKILDHSVNELMVWQQCTSYPHLKFLIKRSSHIIVEYQKSFKDNFKNPQQWKGFQSILFQHQMSHMNCVNMFDICEDVDLVVKSGEDSKQSLKLSQVQLQQNRLKLKQYFGRFKKQRDNAQMKNPNTTVVNNIGEQAQSQDYHNNSKVFYKDSMELKNFIQYQIINPNN